MSNELTEETTLAMKLDYTSSTSKSLSNMKTTSFRYPKATEYSDSIDLRYLYITVYTENLTNLDLLTTLGWVGWHNLLTN